MLGSYIQGVAGGVNTAVLRALSGIAGPGNGQRALSLQGRRPPTVGGRGVVAETHKNGTIVTITVVL